MLKQKQVCLHKKPRLFGLGIGAIAMCFPFFASALDFTPDSSRVISDPSYLPLQGQLYGATGYEYQRITRDSYTLGFKDYSFTQAQQSFSQSLEYGINDDITAAVLGTYVPFDKQDLDYGTFKSEYHFQGLEDPTFSLTWRVLDEKTFPVNLDLTASYAPDFVGNRHATSFSSGTVGLGSDVTGANAAISYKTHSFTVQVLGGADHYGSGNYEVATDNTQSDTDPYWAYFGGVQTQTRFTDAFSLNAGYRYTAFGHEHTTEPSGVAYSTSLGDEHNFDVALNYQLIPNRLVAGVTYNYIMRGDTSNNYTPIPLTTEFKDEQENIFGVRLQYVFF